MQAPSAAAAVARDGDVIRIDPGDYLDCAVWRANGLTIEGGGAVISDKACEGKALFVITGNGMTVRDLTLTRVRVADGNGAGIRLEGRDLTVQRVRFVNNQVGVLAAASAGSRVHIADSFFIRNGACGERGCVGALLVGAAAELVVEGSVFEATQGGHHIVSAAARTEISSTEIRDGEAGTAGYGLNYTGGGDLQLQDCTLQKGPRSSNLRAEILAGGAGWGGAATIVARRNHFVDDTGASVPLLLNWTGALAEMSQNTMQPPGPELSSSGIWLHRLRYLLITAKDGLRHLAGRVRRAL